MDGRIGWQDDPLRRNSKMIMDPGPGTEGNHLIHQPIPLVGQMAAVATLLQQLSRRKPSQEESFWLLEGKAALHEIILPFLWSIRPLGHKLPLDLPKG